MGNIFKWSTKQFFDLSPLDHVRVVFSFARLFIAIDVLLSYKSQWRNLLCSITVYSLSCLISTISSSFLFFLFPLISYTYTQRRSSMTFQERVPSHLDFLPCRLLISHDPRRLVRIPPG